MWLIKEPSKRFTTDSSKVDDAAATIAEARQGGELTLILGNGLSQSSAWLHGLRQKKAGDASVGGVEDVSWLGVVERAAIRMDVPEKLRSRGQNFLALAQSVMIAAEKKGLSIAEARHSLLSDLDEAFRQEILPSVLDEMLVRLAPRDIVTTNYDFQIERAFEKAPSPNWRALVRCGEARLRGDTSTWIHKMHGSFLPDESVSDKYNFAETTGQREIGASVVITESDYDECYQDVGRMSTEHSALMLALSKTCLIVGKSLDAQDLSFMYALRRARHARREARRQAFMLFEHEPTEQESLDLYNLDITPLVVNLPRHRSSGHYYFGTAAALARLFPDLSDLFDKEMENPIAEFSNLVCGPDVIAIGLASRNITGKTTYVGKDMLPPAGRRNLRYSNIEEHIGGSAMTPLMILSALDKKDKEHRLSMASAIGGANDNYSAEILADCKELRIDADAVSCNQKSTWHSTVLVHTSYLKDKSPYRGQRIFLDRGYDEPVVLDEPEAAQLSAQLKQDHLRLVYLDKFLAAHHPPLTKNITPGPELLGPLLQPGNLLILDEALEHRPEIDVMYETGGGGSPFQHVEKALCSRINIFTSGFPFFASVVLYSLGWDLPDSLKVFDPSSKWWEAEFEKETTAIEAMLEQLVDTSSATHAEQRVKPLKLSAALIHEAGRWAGRESGKGKRWFVTTLHHLGAIGIDLVNQKGWYCSPPPGTGKDIENTSGAGDSFRAGLMYALLSETGDRPDALARALWFSTDVATERCQHFLIKEACAAITERFSGRYFEYENDPLP